jgi:uncharacterized caspase-like protein
LEAFAVDADGIWSSPLHIHITRQGALSERNLYVLSIGVNKYQGTIPSLTHACNDAWRFGELLQSSHSLYRNVHVKTLRNQEASMGGIRAQLYAWMATGHPEDAFIFLFSGHGFLRDATDPDDAVFLAAADCDNSRSPTQGFLNLTALRDWMKRLPMQRQAWLFDACNSGSLAMTLQRQTWSRAFRRLYFGTGVSLIAAVSSSPYAVPAHSDPELKSGLLTGILLRGLAGQALSDRTKSHITLEELGDYVEREVPSAAAQRQFVQKPEVWIQPSLFYPEFPLISARESAH